MEFKVVRNNELYHHGIKGQAWGVRNGPPYPLDDNSHSVSEKEAEHNLKSDKNNEMLGLRLTDKQKKYLKIGVAIVAASLATYGVYKLGNNSKINELIAIGTNNVSKGLGSKVDADSLGMSLDKIDMGMVQRINENNEGIAAQSNCFNTSASYILNRLFGMNTTAKGLNRYITKDGADIALYNKMFANLKGHNFIDKEGYAMYNTFDKMSNAIASKSTGIILVRDRYYGTNHFVNYEKNAQGLLTIIDSQNGVIINNNSERYVPMRALDFSKAVLTKTGERMLKDIVNIVNEV